MTVIDNVNKMSKYGLRRKPTYAEVIGMLDDNEKITVIYQLFFHYHQASL
jgi:hypothetical protein